MALRRKPRRPRGRANRGLLHETLEKRELLAAGIQGDGGDGPRLVGANPNGAGIFSVSSLNQLDFAPNELTFRFDGGQELDPTTLEGIKIFSSGGDDRFDDGNEQQIVPGFLGFDGNSQTVVARFNESFPDERYRIAISGVDDTANGFVGLKNIDGVAFCAIDGTSIQTIDFDVEIGGKVIAVVPQPVDPTDGVLTRSERQIDVYFDDADLFESGSNISEPRFYQLVDTGGTVTTEDDVPFMPTSVVIDEAARKVTLEFAQSLDALSGGGTTSYRLRIGDDADFEDRIVTPVSLSTEPGFVIGDAVDLTGTANAATVDGSWTLLIDERIENSDRQLETALDRYVNKPDDTYQYTLVDTVDGAGVTTYIIDMTSQTWRSAAEVDRPVWQHWVQIVVPDSATSDTAVLFIDGGSNGGSAPTQPDSDTVDFALATGQITVHLPTVPNEPLTFTDETFSRTEDEIIAYTLDKFLDGGDEEWPLLLPMVKSAVRAMDTAQDFLEVNTTQDIEEFFVTGYSKRGWTTWLTAAVDNRVSGIVPGVIDVLNMNVSITNHRENYEGVTDGIIGGYAEAIRDYTELGIFDRFDEPRARELRAIVDPYQYRDRLTLPKYILNSAGDQFFTPDSSQFYINDLGGPTYLRYVPNTGHGLNADAAEGAAAFMQLLDAGLPLPQFDWAVEGDNQNSIRVTAVDTPVEVNLWQATNPASLDFRNIIQSSGTVGPVYTSTPLTNLGGGTYLGMVPLPASGGTAFFVELKYDYFGETISFTTEARIAEPLGTPPFDPYADEPEVLRAMADNPGGNDEPGHRDIDVSNDQHLGGGDSDNAITVIPYTFLKETSYGDDVNGTALFNVMNDAQEQRFKEVLELYGSLFGIDFVETESSGLRLIVGDLFTADPTRVSGPGGVAGLGGPGGVTMDFADFTQSASNVFGGSFFTVALHEIGHAIGLGHAYDLEGAVMGAREFTEYVYPSSQDVIHGEHLHQKESLDVDLYRFDIDEPGMVVAHTIAERLSDSSLLDTRLTLFKQTSEGIELMAANDDTFGSDSFLELAISPGTYFVGVAAEGNVAFDLESGLTTAGGTSAGPYNLRLSFQSDSSNSIVDADGSRLDGDRDGEAGGNYNFWFKTASTADTIYVRKPDLESDLGGDGSLAAPLDTIDDALALADTKDSAIVRVLANDGSDNNVETLEDNEAYEVGFVPGINVTLDDGRNVIVPDNTSLVIDAGAILKFTDSRISVGSDDNGVDRSGSSIQVLGTPALPVFFTSFSDTSKGVNSDPFNDVPQSGQWGGIQIRNDVDRSQGRPDAEREGIFPNYINHAVIEYGGGVVTTIGRTIDSVQLNEARAEVSYNTIENSARAAISVDPNSFEYTTFVAPRYQRSSVSGDGFVADYRRIGADVRGNQLSDNFLNALFVRIDTLPGEDFEPLAVAARFDDTDIVHALRRQTLLVQGQPGGPMQETVRPNPILSLSGNTGGAILAGTYHYSYTQVDRLGQESIASIPQAITLGGAFDSIQLAGIPATTDDFVGRRIYRSDNGGDFRLVAELDRSAGNYLDTLAVPADNAPSVNPNSGRHNRGRPDASLIVDPGTIIKSDTARIELGFGATLISEGTEGAETIYTSAVDQRYGAGGTFDTFQDLSLASDPSPGDWAGIYADRTSRLSLDHAVVAYGGGVAGIGGSTAGFNAVEIHQAEARIANSRFENNADGIGGQDPVNRQGRLPNSTATIHIAGAQPIIVDNRIVDGDGAAISINVNALESFPRQDSGRQTGLIDIREIPPGNEGPVVRGNQLDGNYVNGLGIRGGILQTEVVLDDTDIVHAIESDITVNNFHTYGGLRLESSPTESLIVKFAPDAGLIASGETLEITDRIGGRIQVLGTLGNPVVLTSVFDDSVGAGFTPDGVWQTETFGGGPELPPGPGNWQGILLDAYSHDRNLDTVLEFEGSLSGAGDANAVIGAHQELGELAPNQLSGDENRRLGFTLHGTIAAGADRDMYSFDGTAGSMVWIDIDRTDAGLDTVLELLDGNGNVLALSENSRDESITGELTYVNYRDVTTGDFIGFDPDQALPMPLNPDAKTNRAGGGSVDLYSTNDGDAAMRVVLPGSVGTVRTFYVRVRSSNPSDLSDPVQIADSVTDGKTSGTYQLQVRLQEIDEIAGSTIRYSDIRYATRGIEVLGLPSHSPLGGELFNPTTGAVNTLDLGSLGNTDRGAISVAGQGFNSDQLTFTTTDSYTFTVSRDDLQSLPGALLGSGVDQKVSTVIDVDYADGIQRPDTNVYLYHDGQLVAIGTNSNISDDQVVPLIPNQDAPQDKLSGGSFGPKDAFIGPLELSTIGEYEVVVSNAIQIPANLLQFTDAEAVDTLVRLEPLDSTVRIADDRFDGTGGSSRTPILGQTPVTLQVAFEDDGDNIVPWHIGDVPLIAVTGTSRLAIYNPLTGNHDANIIDEFPSTIIDLPAPLDPIVVEIRIGAIAAAARGDVIAIQSGELDDAPVYSMDVEGNLTGVGSTGITSYFTVLDDGNFTDESRDPPPVAGLLADGDLEFVSLAFYNDTDSQNRFLYGLAHRGLFQGAVVTGDFDNREITDRQTVDGDNLIYLLNPDTGAAIGRANGIEGMVNNMPGGLNSADPQDVLGMFADFVNIPDEAPHAGTDIIAQIRIPKMSPATGGNTGKVVDIIADPAGGAFLYAFTEEGAVWKVRFGEGTAENVFDEVNFDFYGDYAAGDVRPVFAPNTNEFLAPALELVVDPTLPGAIPGVDFFVDADGTPLQFNRVMAGPTNFDQQGSGADPSQLFYGVVDGPGPDPDNLPQLLYAFDLRPEIADPSTVRASTTAPLFAFGGDRITLEGMPSVTGMFFSPLDRNLWHLSDTEEDTAGHGMPELDSAARPEIKGGGSLKFGFDALNDDFSHLSQGVFDDNLDADDLQNIVGYNFLGGAHGTVESNSIDLSGTVSEDLPTLYFTYLLDTENRNSGDLSNDDERMRDSLRVYVSGDDGQWSMVATNNFDDDANELSFDWLAPGATREYEPQFSNYGDTGADRRFVQQLFDGTDFRQARVELGPWAGNEDVKIRFEFSTAGESRPDQSEIFAMPGYQITDGHRLTVSGLMPDKDNDLMGAALSFDSKEFEFDVLGNGTSFGTIPINITPNSTTIQVRDAIRQALANEIRFMNSVPDGSGNHSTDAFPVHGDSVRLFDLSISQATAGRPLTLIQGEFSTAGANLPASEFGVYSGSNLGLAGQRSKGLGGSLGVHIDDIVIGLAERGESVGGASILTPDTGPTGALDVNPYYLPRFNGQVLPEIVEGPYQLEIRTARDYADIQNEDLMTKQLGALVQPNERLAVGLNLIVIHDGAAISDGDTFTLSNGSNTLTFEFNRTGGPADGNTPVSYSLTDDREQIAAAILDAINVSAVHDALQIVATNRGGQKGSEASFLETDPVVVLHGYAAADVHGGLEFGPHFNPILTGTDVVLGEDNGDRNRYRDQGQLLIDSNSISYSSEFGLVIDAGTTAPSGPFNDGNSEGDRPKPGAVRNLPTQNSTGQVPGAVIRNNLLYLNETGGILISGDASVGAPSAYLRALNNTVYGSTIGIQIDETASPALLNNVVMANDTGINIAGAGETLIRGTVFEGNGVNATTAAGIGDDAIIDPGSPLFINATSGPPNFVAGQPNFIPEAGSPLIDSSIAGQTDRPLLVNVKNVVGIPASPVLVPPGDLRGQTRGQGSFADRGSLERLDARGPLAALIQPADNDPSGIDLDPSETVVRLASGRLSYFEILLDDQLGSGMDASTIGADQIAVIENGQMLIAASDYVIGYGQESGLLRLTPTSGEWRPDSVYEIRLLNQDVGGTLAIADLSGNLLEPNRLTGDTVFSILMPDVISDFGDAPVSYGTLLVDNAARHTSSASQLPRLGDLIDGELDGQPVDGDDSGGQDDEDGLQIGTLTVGPDNYVVFTAPLTDPSSVGDEDVIGFLNPLESAGTDMAIKVAGGGLLNAWIDFDFSGTFEPDERVITDQSVIGDPIDGSFVTVNVVTPSGTAEGLTWMRMRISESVGIGPNGVAIGGEVEDYPVEIIAINPIVTVDDQYTIDEDTTLDTTAPGFSSVRDNDSIPADVFTSTDVNVIDDVDNGVLTMDPSTGDFDYTPNDDFFGTDTFTYRLGALSTTRVATVTITVDPINDPPFATTSDVTITRTIDEDVVQTFEVAELIGDLFEPGPTNESDQPLILQSAFSGLGVGQSEQGGTLSISSDGLTLTYTPPLDYNSQTVPDTFSYVVADVPGSGQTSLQADLLGQVVVSFRPVNDPPRPRDDGGYVADENQTISIPIGSETTDGILRNDFDDVPAGEDGQAILLVDGQFPKSTSELGTVTRQNGLLIYTPLTSFSGIDTFDYFVEDEFGATASATVSISVANTLNPPDIIGSIDGNVQEDGTLVSDLSTVFDDPDGQSLNYFVAKLGDLINPTPAQIADHPLVESIDFIGDQMRIELDANQFGSVEIEIGATDGDFSVSTTFTLNVSSVPDAPVAMADGFNVPVGSTLVVADPAAGLLANDSDGDNDSFMVDVANVVSITPGGPLGTLDVNPNGTFTYVNTSGSPGDEDVYEYRIIDQTVLASVTVEVRFVLNQSEYQNPIVLLTEDVNADGFITAIDALRIINFLGRRGASEVPVSEIGLPPPDFSDVNGNGIVSALDALIVVNRLREINNGGAGEQTVEIAPVSARAATAVTSNFVSGASIGLPIRNLEPVAAELDVEPNDQVLALGLEISPASAERAVNSIVERQDSSALTNEELDAALSDVLDEWEVQDQLD